MKSRAATTLPPLPPRRKGDVTYVYCTGGRTDHRDETDRRYEGNPDGDDIRDNSGVSHSRASGSGSEGVLAMAAVEWSSAAVVVV